MSIISEKPLLEPLVAFVERVSSQDEIFSLKEEALIAKHTLTFFNPIVAKHIDKINSILRKDKLSSEDNKNLVVLQNSLREIGDTLNDTLKKVSSIVKAAAEIEDMKASRVDGIQLLHALRQIPKIIAAIVESLVETVIAEIEQAVVSSVDDKTYLRILQKSDYLGKSRTMTVAAVVAETVENLNARLEVISMPIRSVDANPAASDNAVTLDQVKGMINTVP
jgi:hypothetical protein